MCGSTPLPDAAIRSGVGVMPCLSKVVDALVVRVEQFLGPRAQVRAAGRGGVEAVGTALKPLRALPLLTDQGEPLSVNEPLA